MQIQLTRQQIDTALPKVAGGLDQYVWLQSKVDDLENFHDHTEFRRKFNHFYRVRRSAIWQEAYYGLMARANREHLQFAAILDELRQATTRFEASFASKLFATLHPSAPVIDSVVLRNLGLRLPYPYVIDRAAQVSKLHQQVAGLYAAFLDTKNGKYLVLEFERVYPTHDVTEEKMLDLVQWQTRD